MRRNLITLVAAIPVALLLSAGSASALPLLDLDGPDVVEELVDGGDVVDDGDDLGDLVEDVLDFDLF